MLAYDTVENELNGPNKIGGLVTDMFEMMGYDVLMNKYGVPMINSICHMFK